jgi:hypothetical protein
MNYDDVVKTPDFIRNPFPFYAHLRREDPVHWSDHWGAWLLTRYDDIKQCLLDTETFSSRGRAISHFATLFTPGEREQLQPLQQQFLEGLISSDPPDHTRLKRFMLRGIRPMNDADLKEVVRDLAEELLAKVKPARRMEAVKDFAYPLPIYVTLAILGVPQTERDRLKAACEQFLQLSTDPRPSFAKALAAQRGLLEIKQQFALLLEARRRTPGHDFISNLAEGEREGGSLRKRDPHHVGDRSDRRPRNHHLSAGQRDLDIAAVPPAVADLEGGFRSDARCCGGIHPPGRAIPVRAPGGHKGGGDQGQENQGRRPGDGAPRGRKPRSRGFRGSRTAGDHAESQPPSWLRAWPSCVPRRALCP